MQKFIFILLFAISAVHLGKVAGQKIIGDCTITYQVSAAQKTIDSNNLKNAYKKFYVSGGKSVTEISFNGFEQKTYCSENSDDVYIFYNMNNEKYMRQLSRQEWLEQYDKYKNAETETYEESKNILGYNCRKGRTRLADGTIINFYYTPELKTLVSENPYEFKDINGLVLSYEAVVQNQYRITYTASNIDFNPVPAAIFTIPKSGYRILSGHGLQ